MIQQEKEKNTGKQPVYQRLWFRMTAFLLAAIMVFSIWAGGAIQIRIKARSEQDAAGQYLINNTDYVQSGELGRFEEKMQTYLEPRTLEDYYRLAGTPVKRLTANTKVQVLDDLGWCVLVEYEGGTRQTLTSGEVSVRL